MSWRCLERSVTFFVFQNKIYSKEVLKKSWKTKVCYTEESWKRLYEMSTSRRLWDQQMFAGKLCTIRISSDFSPVSVLIFILSFWQSTPTLLSRSCLINLPWSQLFNIAWWYFLTILMLNLNWHYTNTDHFNIKLSICRGACHIFFSSCFFWRIFRVCYALAIAYFSF